MCGRALSQETGEGAIKEAAVWAVESPGTWRQGGGLPYPAVSVTSGKEGRKNRLSSGSPLDLYLKGQGYPLPKAQIALFFFSVSLISKCK